MNWMVYRRAGGLESVVLMCIDCWIDCLCLAIRYLCGHCDQSLPYPSSSWCNSSGSRSQWSLQRRYCHNWLQIGWTPGMYRASTWVSSGNFSQTFRSPDFRSDRKVECPIGIPIGILHIGFIPYLTWATMTCLGYFLTQEAKRGYHCLLNPSLQFQIAPEPVVSIVMLEKLDSRLSKSATRPYRYEYKCKCMHTDLCIDPSGGQQSLVIWSSPPARREPSPATSWQRPIIQYSPSCYTP